MVTAVTADEKVFVRAICSNCVCPTPYEGPTRPWHHARKCDLAGGRSEYLKAYSALNGQVPLDGRVPSDVMEHLMLAADLGASSAMYLLGQIYGRRHDKASNAAWMDLAAMLGHRCALMQRGEGVAGPISPNLADLYLYAALQSGCILACLELCRSHCSKDREDGGALVPLFVLERAAKAGHPKAAQYLALIYRDGFGVKRSSRLTAFWAKRGHELGNPICTTWLRKNAPKELRPEN